MEVNSVQPITFLSFWIVNSILLWVVGQLVPKEVVLGNQHVLSLWASILAGFILAAVDSLVGPTLAMTKVKPTGDYHWVLTFFAANSVALWIITRFALLIGVGIAAFWWAVILGIIITFGQWTMWAYLKPTSKKQ